MQTTPSGLKLGLDQFEGSRQKTFPIPDARIRGLASCLFTKMEKVVAKHWTRWAFYRKKSRWDGQVYYALVEQSCAIRLTRLEWKSWPLPKSEVFVSKHLVSMSQIVDGNWAHWLILIWVISCLKRNVIAWNCLFSKLGLQTYCKRPKMNIKKQIIGPSHFTLKKAVGPK